MIYLELFLTFLKIGAFTFGGGYAMIPIIESEVLHKGWLTQSELINFLAVSESTPGSFSVNVSTYIGNKTAGIFGAISATIGVVLPSFIIILIISGLFLKFRKNKYVISVMDGLKAAVVGLIGSAVVSVGTSAFFPNGVSADNFLTWNVLATAIICAGCVILSFKEVNPILVIAISAGAGLACMPIPGIHV